MITQQQAEQLATSIKKTVIGSIIAEYGALEIKGNARQELKQKVNGVVNASKSLQRYFLTHRHGTEQSRTDFREEFHRDEIYLLSEILMLLWGVPYDGLEEIYKTLQAHIQPVPAEQ